MKQLSVSLARASVALVFLAFGIWEIIDPTQWAGFVPGFMMFLNVFLLVRIHGVVLILIGIALAFGKFMKIATALSLLMLLQIIAELRISSGFSDPIVDRKSVV